MQIEHLTLWQLDLPLAKPYRLSGGRLLFEKLDSTTVRIDTDTGLSGWGEACPWGATYLPAHGRGARAAIAEIAPAVVGLDPRRIDLVNRAMDTALPGHIYAKSAVDMACWDILGKATGLPLVELLGGRTEEPITLQSSISTGTPDEMVAAVESKRKQGYRVHSAKIGADPEMDVTRIRALEAARAPGESITYDVNRAWLPEQGIRVMNSVADVQAYFEQPCETLEECAVLRRLTRQPIILDECIHTFHDLVRMQRESIGEAIGLKIGRVGGLTKARRMRDFCVSFGILMNIEETGGTVLADTAACHLAHSTPVTHRRGTWLCHEMLTVDIAPGQGARGADGTATAPNLPGLGVEPDLAVLGKPVAVYE